MCNPANWLPKSNKLMLCYVKVVTLGKHYTVNDSAAQVHITSTNNDQFLLQRPSTF